jgi:hypothetical protein
MVHALLIPFTHVAPIDHNDTLLPKVVYGKRIFPRAADQAKTATFKGTLISQTLFQGKRNHHYKA